MLERVCKMWIRDLAQQKQRLTKVSADFKQTIVDEPKTSRENDSGPVWRLKDSTLIHAVACGAVHSLNRQTHCFKSLSFQLIVAIGYWLMISAGICYGPWKRGLSILLLVESFKQQVSEKLPQG